MGVLPLTKTCMSRLRVVMSVLVLMLSHSLMAQTYTYSYMPSMGSYTSTGSGTSTEPAINYSNGTLAGGMASYTNGQIKATVYSHTSSTITLRVAKESGYFKSGNTGKVLQFVLPFGEMETYTDSHIQYGCFLKSSLYRLFK